MRVIVEAYNAEWVHQFEAIKAELEQNLQEVRYISIEHVGSTSVPVLAAKPVIDLSVISKRGAIKDAIQALTSKGGYAYMSEMGVPDRHALRKAGAVPARHLYVSVERCQSIRNHLTVREICRKDPRVRGALGRSARAGRTRSDDGRGIPQGQK